MSGSGEGSNAVVRSATGMGAAAAASRVIGGGRVLVIAAVLGTTYLGNAFQGANTVSNLLFELLGRQVVTRTKQFSERRHGAFV